LPKAVIFDVDGTLIDSVDLHAAAWRDAFAQFNCDVSFEKVRSQIGKGGDKLIPAFLSEAQQDQFGKDLEAWRGTHFKENYLPLIRPFSAVPELLHKIRETGRLIGIASSAKKSELSEYLDIAGISHLVDATTSSGDVSNSKPDPDVFEAILAELDAGAPDALAIGDTPYDAEAARKAGIATIGVLSGGFSEASLRESGCIAVYPGTATLFAQFSASPLAAGGLE
jgi:phosphoglycolate phosphatase-like HAD superfamily hydrolase